jgi:hypothetical protein
MRTSRSPVSGASGDLESFSSSNLHQFYADLCKFPSSIV